MLLPLTAAAGDSRQESSGWSLSEDHGRLVVSVNGHDLVAYQFEWLAPPEGVDAAYGRSGFVHPLWSPQGQVLTRIQPPDHYHHYGIWNPWTHVGYDDGVYDLWNLAERQGTVRFAGFVSRTLDDDAAEFTVRHEHVAFVGPDTPVVIMNELQTIRVHHASDDRYIMDMTVRLEAATDKPVTLLEYRYGGFGWRATEEWNKDNSEVAASEGQDRSNADNSRGRWFYVQGEVGGSYAGALVMSHPDNFNHPEPMRIWPIPENERGDVFASFSPTKNTDWRIEPGRQYTRTYRFLVYNGHMNRQEAEAAWQEFAHAPSRDVAPEH
jgi:hypothetical protein